MRELLGPVLLKFAVLAVLLAMLGGCFFWGDRIVTANIYVDFPQKDKEEVLPLMLELGDRLGLERGTRPMVNGKEIFRDCQYVDAPQRAECKRVLVEDRDKDSITILLVERRPTQQYIIDAEAVVKIASYENGSRVTIDFEGLAELPKQDIRLYYTLKEALLHDYSYNVTTKDP